METIRKLPFSVASLNAVASFVWKTWERVFRTFQLGFLPPNDPVSGNNGGKEESGKEVVHEWERSDPAAACNAMFARTGGGGRDDSRPPDFNRYLMFGLSESESQPGNGECTPVKVKLSIETGCPGGNDNLVIDRIPEFHKEKLTEVLAMNNPGEHSYYTIQSPNVETEYLTFVPEIISGGAIRIRHQNLKSIANLGIQFLVRTR